ncbi:GTPase Era [Phaeocystidibacter marisrubri]|uniref:GTPase Era n=1 Tax=Phaeocystidibacter marisrubri TaxID=1577780 RepID=A0A6L3ZEI9_9FLAO|nr:GTPase Era [Phaeocystidibacter marisrubri]KAB2816100.1 GTPase Era [Phaeocystidibacter marisrubri]GGH67327.1 GTPase Era [Phaeocystidibacter marisrubri]
MAHKAGFVNIIGNPNVGKSTTMNAMLGERLSIITPKAQTTRHRIFGILNGEDYQVVFSDTPGVIRPAYALQESMMQFVSSAFEDADVFLYLVEVGERALKDENFYNQLKNTKTPLLLGLNKIDTVDQDKLEEEVAYWKGEFPNAEIIPLSALKKFNTDHLLSRMIALLPESPPYFAKDQLTDRSERFFASEIIREKILMNYKKEVPYSVEVNIDEFKEEEDIIRIRAVILVARESQKGIIIGHKGAMLKKVGSESRLEMEKFFQKKVFLETFVKVNKDWRDDQRKLKQFGY